jgi:hypothetical protein
MKIFKLAIAVLALLIVGISIAGAFPTETRACNGGGGCHTLNTSINVTSDVTSTLTVQPNQIFKVNTTWSGGSATRQTVAKWPTDFTNIAITRNNSLFNATPVMSTAAVSPSSILSSVLTAPNAIGNYIVRVYASTATPFITNFQDINITVEAPVLTSITVSPATASLTPGNNTKFNATAKDQNGIAMSGINITWTSSNTTVGTVAPVNILTGTDGNASVTFNAIAAGTAMVNATNNTLKGSAIVTVALATQPVLTSITVSPATASLTPGNNTKFNATAKDQNGIAMSGINITWTSNNINVGTVTPVNVLTGADGNASVTFNAIAAGNINITATNGSYKANATVIIADSIINLNMGWNLISIPNFAAQNGVAQVLANVRYNAIWEFDPATMNFTTPSVLIPLKGYWINVTAPNQSIGFIAAGTVIPSMPPTRNLYEGWNLIGVAASRNDSSSLNASVVFAGLKNGQVGPLYSMLVNYDDMANPHTSIVGSDLTDTTKLNQGQGYWLFINPLVNYPRNNVPWAGKVW